MKFAARIISVGVLLSAGLAQTPQRLQFDAVSIKPVEGLVAGQPASGGVQADPSQIHYARSSLRSLIAAAYNLRLYQIIGPEWLESRFDVGAKLPAGSTRGQAPEMLQSMLADRFAMKAHNEPREFSVYALRVVSGGTTLKDVATPDDAVGPKDAAGGTGYGGPGRMGGRYNDGAAYALENEKFDAKKFTTARLAGLLTSWLDKPVVDMTGLNGKYDMSFSLTDEDLRALVTRAFLNGGGLLPPQVIQQLDSLDLASLHAGLSMLGFKLENTKSSVPALIIDSIRKTPTEN
jgi:uncharacterized protein (TIGR03435 family)